MAKGWDRLKQSEEKAKKQQEAVKNAKYQPTTTRHQGAYKNDNISSRSATQSKQYLRQYEDDKNEARRQFDASRSNMSRADRIRQNARAKQEGYDNSFRREKMDREVAASKYAANRLAQTNRQKLEQAFREEANGGKKVTIRNANLRKKYGR